MFKSTFLNMSAVILFSTIIEDTKSITTYLFILSEHQSTSKYFIIWLKYWFEWNYITISIDITYISLIDSVESSYDYKDDYDYDYSTDDAGTGSSSDDTSTSSNTTASSVSGNDTNSTDDKIQKINSASSALGLNILLTPDIANYFGDLKQGNSEGFRVM